MGRSFVVDALFFCAGVVFFILTVFVVLYRDNMEGKKAKEMTEKVLLDLAAVVAENKEIKNLFEKYNQDTNSDYQSVVEQALKVSSENEKIKTEYERLKYMQEKMHEKLNWVEVKVNAQRQMPAKIILSQEAPLKVSMIYKKVNQKKTPEQVQREKLIQKTKTQVQELSK